MAMNLNLYNQQKPQMAPGFSKPQEVKKEIPKTQEIDFAEDLESLDDEPQLEESPEEYSTNK